MNNQPAFAAYIPVVPQTQAPMAPPTKVADFDPGVVTVLITMVIGLVLLSRSR